MRRVMCVLTAATVVAATAACQRQSTGALPSPAVTSPGLGQSAVSGGADWPRFLGPNGDGVSPEKGINKNWNSRPPKMLWQFSMGDQGYAGPSVANGLVYIIDHSGAQDIVRALELRTGKQAWAYAYADDSNANYGYARSTPTVDGGKVYTLSRLGVLNCLDAKTGRMIWTKNIVRDFGGRIPSWQLAGSPYIDGNKLVVLPGGPNAAVVALDKTSGATIWRGGGSDQPGYSTPVAATINGVKQYVVFTAKSMIGVDAGSGKLIWSVPWQTSYDVNAAGAIVGGNKVFMTTGYGHGSALLAVSQNGASIEWQNKQLVSRFSTPVLINGMIYGIGEPGNLVCLDTATGAARWKQGGFDFGGVCAVDGTIIALAGASGQCVMVRATPESYQELGKFTPLGEQSWTAPIVAQGRLIVRNTKMLACFDLK